MAATDPLIAGSPPEPQQHTALPPVVGGLGGITALSSGAAEAFSTGHICDSCGRRHCINCGQVGSRLSWQWLQPGVLGHLGTLDVPEAPALPAFGSVHPPHWAQPVPAALFYLGSCPLDAGLAGAYRLVSPRFTC